MVRFLLYANEWDIEGIVTSSSQYHWQGYEWAGDDWIDPYLDAYAKVYPNLIKHDPGFPTPDYLRERTRMGNVKAESEMEEVTEGSQLIVKVLLDDTDHRPIWLQAWGGWGGRFVWVRDNTWLDPSPYEGYVHPEGRYFRDTCWGRLSLNAGMTSHNDKRMLKFFKPAWRWPGVQQNDWAARADWCVKPYDEANHPPVVAVDHAVDLKFKPGQRIELDATGSTDIDHDLLSYAWKFYPEAGTYRH